MLKSGFGAWAPLGSGSGSTRIGEPLVYGGLFGAHRSRAGGAGGDLLERRRGGAGPRALAGPRRRRSRRAERAQGGHGSQRGDTGRPGRPRGPQVLVDGEPVELEPARELPLNWGYFLA